MERIYYLCNQFSNRAPKVGQQVLEFDFLALRERLSCFLILRFISFVTHGRLCLNLVVLYGDNQLKDYLECF